MTDIIGGDNNKAEDPSVIEIKIKVTRTNKGDQVHVDVVPATIFPDYVLTAMQRAVLFYERRLQAIEVIKGFQEHQQSERLLRGIDFGKKG